MQEEIKRDLLKVARDMISLFIAMSTLIGIVYGAWAAIGGPLPVSMSKHTQDVADLRSIVEKYFNNLRRMNLKSRIDILESKIITINTNLAEVEDAIQVHTHSLTAAGFTDDDKEIARRRIRSLTALKEEYDNARKRIAAEIEKTNQSLERIPIVTDIPGGDNERRN